MTEKSYGGESRATRGRKDIVKEKEIKAEHKLEKKSEKKEIQEEQELELESYKKAGKIAKETKEYARTILKKDMLLYDLAEKIEAKIKELGGEIAFPTNLSINDIAAHYTPTRLDETKAQGLLKIDLGVSIEGFIADCAFSVDLTEDKKYEKLIIASEKGLESAIAIIKKNKSKTTISEIGKEIEKTIKNLGFIPIVNLTGHGLGKFNLHSGTNIPNCDNSSTKEIGEGAFAIEPFATLKEASGSIYEGGNSNIFHLSKEGAVRSDYSREVLSYILEHKKLLPFSKREIEKKFSTKGLLAIRELQNTGIIEEFPQLIEKQHKPVSQAESTLIITENNVEVIV